MNLTGDVDAARTVQSEDERWIDAFHRGDADALATIYAADVVVLPPDAPALVGRPAVRAWFREFFGDHDAKQRLVNDQVHAEGRLAVMHGRFDLEIRPRDGGPVARRRGKHLVVWRRDEDGRWRAWRDIWNLEPVDDPGQ